MSKTPQIFESQRECLLASGFDDRKVFVATDRNNKDGVFWWGLAVSEHQFRQALSAHVWDVSKLTERERLATCQTVARQVMEEATK